MLRYWETQFDQLAPSKNRAGNRVYLKDDLELIALIQHLVHTEKYTLEGARQRLAELQSAERPPRGSIIPPGGRGSHAS